jgi:ribose transport system permease protein
MLDAEEEHGAAVVSKAGSRLQGDDTGAKSPVGKQKQVGGSGQHIKLAFNLERFALVGAWAVVIAIFGILRPSSFLTMGNVGTILGSQATLVVVTLALLLVLVAGDYDLSVAGTLTLSSMMLGVMNGEHHVPIMICIVAALVMGLVVGFVNGFFVVVFGIDSMIVTLGMGSVLAGIVLWISNSMTISGVSNGLVNLVVNDTFLGIPLEFYYGVVICAAIWYFLAYTAGGRRVLFVGRGRSVARLSGVSVGRVRWGCLIFAGLCAALAGVIYTGTTGAADPTSGLTYLLPAFAGCFLGATSIEPGRFNALGAFIAVYFLVTGINGLSILGAQSYVQNLFYGGALIVAVVFSQMAKMRADRRQKEEDRSTRERPAAVLEPGVLAE